MESTVVIKPNSAPSCLTHNIIREKLVKKPPRGGFLLRPVCARSNLNTVLRSIPLDHAEKAVFVRRLLDIFIYGLDFALNNPCL